MSARCEGVEEVPFRPLISSDRVKPVVRLVLSQRHPK
jgi:hypothetical protein